MRNLINQSDLITVYIKRGPKMTLEDDSKSPEPKDEKNDQQKQEEVQTEKKEPAVSVMSVIDGRTDELVATGITAVDPTPDFDAEVTARHVPTISPEYSFLKLFLDRHLKSGRISKINTNNILVSVVFKREFVYRGRRCGLRKGPCDRGGLKRAFFEGSRNLLGCRLRT